MNKISTDPISKDIGSPNHWEDSTRQEVNSVAGKIEAHLSSLAFSERKEIGPISPEQILPFASAVLPANDAVLGKIFPGYKEPTSELLTELRTYAGAKENYGTAPGEAAALIVELVKAIQPETAFVFGTARGRLEQLIARSHPDVEIATIDLPTDLVSTAKGKPDTNNIRYRNNIGITDDTRIGDIFRSDPDISSRVHQILGDSFTFEPKQLEGKFRFIVVDGNHQLPNSLMDLANAVELAHRDGAVIVVDDFRKASPLNSGVDGAVSIFCQLTKLPALMPCPRPGEAGLQACAAVIVVPTGFNSAEVSKNLKDLANALKSAE